MKLSFRYHCRLLFYPIHTVTTVTDRRFHCVATCQAKIVCDLPNNKLEHFEGTYILEEGEKVRTVANLRTNEHIYRKISTFIKYIICSCTHVHMYHIYIYTDMHEYTHIHTHIYT